MKTADKFILSGFGIWINSKPGRVFRICAGLAFLAAGVKFHNSTLGVLSLVWCIFPLSAGLFDVCYISAALRGPFRGDKIRSLQKVT